MSTASLALRVFIMTVVSYTALQSAPGHSEQPAIARIGVLVPPLVWGVQYRFSPDALLLVLASDPYDPDEYIRDYDEFRSLIALLPDDEVESAGGVESAGATDPGRLSGKPDATY